jgi:hypothetical protein
MYTIRANFDFHYTFALRNALRHVADRLGFILIQDDSIPGNSLYVNDKPIGYIVYEDAFHFVDQHIKHMNANDYQKIFKYHYSPNIIDYTKLPIDSKYLDRIIPCGLWRSWTSVEGNGGINYKWNKHDLLTRNRSIDVQATMRHTNSGTPPDPKDWPAWSNARLTLMNGARSMATEGYNTVVHMKPRDVYANSLKDTKLGFIWSASSYLGWKIGEFIQEGVIMITEPLGKDYPLCNNVVLEDGVHCIFEKNPKNFVDVAKELLKDPAKMQEIKTNCLNLWEDKLSQDKIGEWFFKELIDAYNEGS